ncbi:hypothetical protein M440DRAFT_337752 [Trichoderma longibrachiatum ATCC 18648]|uniref:Uncharacterized protein n=1 Tax=Trichoderma longibrachiatum ATCC 18648 TaxID=983965 RepID=A0A2T4C0W1_TRILO|nr:hypothetical protein M440DRAFT_337752 [Trichoderma longibrachiatum ATCC 18648]
MTGIDNFLLLLEVLSSHLMLLMPVPHASSETNAPDMNREKMMRRGKEEKKGKKKREIQAHQGKSPSKRVSGANPHTQGTKNGREKPQNKTIELRKPHDGR